MTAYKQFTDVFTCTSPMNLSPATSENVERMGGQCAICWGTLVAADSADSSSSASVLPCSHTYHTGCLIRWMEQCLSQDRVPKCPMCQVKIEYQTCLQWPWSRKGQNVGSARAQGEEDGDAVAEEGMNGGEDFLFGDPNLQELLEDMPDIPAEVFDGEGHVHRILGREEIGNEIGYGIGEIDGMEREEVFPVDGSETCENDLDDRFSINDNPESLTPSCSDDWIALDDDDEDDDYLVQENISTSGDREYGCEADSRTQPSALDSTDAQQSSLNQSDSEALSYTQTWRHSCGRLASSRPNVDWNDPSAGGLTSG